MWLTVWLADSDGAPLRIGHALICCLMLMLFRDYSRGLMLIRITWNMKTARALCTLICHIAGLYRLQ